MVNLKNLFLDGYGDSLGRIVDMNYLFESPMRLKAYSQDEFSNSSNNVMFTRKVKEKVKSEKKYRNYDYYSYKMGDTYYDLFVEGEFTVCFFSYQINTNNIMVGKKVWQDGIKIGLAREIIFDFYLPQFNGIISDTSLSELGGSYWKKLAAEAKRKGYKTYVVFKDDKRIEINDPEEMEKYYGYNEKLSRCRFLILK